jgi:hypothetical protein
LKDSLDNAARRAAKAKEKPAGLSSKSAFSGVSFFHRTGTVFRVSKERLTRRRQMPRNLFMRLIISMVSLAVAILPALADRQVTEDERAKLSAAVQAEGCSGGKFELDEEDDQQFEVDDAVCADGKKYDLKFDMQMRLKRKNLD